MAIAGLIVALIAVAIATASYLLSRKADKRAERAEKRAERAEGRAEDESLAQRRPSVTLRQTTKPKDGPQAGQVVHEYEVGVGSAPIAGLWLWIEDADGEPILGGAGGEQVTLAPGGSPQFMGVGVMHPQRAEQRLMVRWRDADGEYGPEPTRITPRAESPG